MFPRDEMRTRLPGGRGSGNDGQQDNSWPRPPDSGGGGLRVVSDDTPVHYPSHRGLVHRPPARLRRGAVGAHYGPAGILDVVVVPATRAPRHLARASRVALEAGSELLVLCSGETDHRRVLDLIAMLPLHPAVTAVDVDRRAAGELFPFRADSLAEQLHHRDRPDTSLKRNLGLLLARMRRWRHVLFLDDDIVDDHASLVGRTCDVLTDHRLEAVGWAYSEFPDNSVVCHAGRLAGLAQDTFIGGGALAVRLGLGTPFFPDVYNEDWLFLHDLVARRSVALAGDVRQLPYDPFLDTGGAEWQEFGDALAEGLFRRLHQGRGVDGAKFARFWRSVIGHRRAFLAEIGSRLAHGASPGDPVRIRQARACVIGAVAALDESWAEQLARYVRLWRQDLADWRRVLAEVPPCGDLAGCLDLLGLAEAADRLPPRYTTRPGARFAASGT